jgi:hypothetical protein
MCDVAGDGVVRVRRSEPDSINLIRFNWANIPRLVQAVIAGSAGIPFDFYLTVQLDDGADRFGPNPRYPLADVPFIRGWLHVPDPTNDLHQ